MCHGTRIDPKKLELPTALSFAVHTEVARKAGTLMWTSEYGRTHTDMIVPLCRMQANVASEEGFVQEVDTFAVTIVVRREFLCELQDRDG